jgi:Tol biopolymer transport system component
VTSQPAAFFDPGGRLDDSVKGQLITVQQDESGVRVLYLVDIVRGDSVQLAPIQKADMALAPQWSLDGRKIAWASRSGEEASIAVYDFDQAYGQILDVGQRFLWVDSPSWKGSENLVSFYAKSEDDRYWLNTVDGLTGQLVEQYNLPDYRNLFVWNWHRNLIAYAQPITDPYHEVHISDSPRASGQVITPGIEAYAPSWSRDGEWLAFQGISNVVGEGNEIWLVKYDGSGLRQVTYSPAGTWSRAPAWSPDGKYIAYVSNQAGSIGDDYGEVFIVEVATSRVRKVTHTGGKVYDWRPDWRPE